MGVLTPFVPGPAAGGPAAITGSAVAHLRVCANSDSVDGVLDYLPVSAETDRERYAAIGRALADPKRLCVLESLAIGELSVSDLSTRVGCQVPNMSQHLAVLRNAGLVTSRREGNTILYRLADERVLEAYRLIQDIAR
jgi:DNA-binding transcriptional ArsR family regulator